MSTESTESDMTAPAAEPVCPYCGKPDAGWLTSELQRGKRMRPDLLEYHCIKAFYGAQ